jgi:ribosomal protein L15
MKKGDKPGEGQKDKWQTRQSRSGLDKKGGEGNAQAILEIYKSKNNYVKEALQNELKTNKD